MPVPSAGAPRPSAGPARRLASFLEPFAALHSASRVFWICLAVYTLDGAAYFGILNVLTLLLGDTLHFSDAIKHPAVSLMTGTLTAAGVLFGGVSDRLGVRRTLTLTIAVALGSRALLGAAPLLPGSSALAWLALVAIGASAGVMQPAVYAGVKQSTSAGSATIGFSLLYALMNGGNLIEAYLSPLIRAHFRPSKLPGGESLEYAAVVWFVTGVTAVYLVIHLVGFPRSAGAPVAGADAGGAGRRPAERGARGLLDPRFLFFIFILLGVRTLFAHQWMTMPDYISRTFDRSVADRYEWILSINPFIILFATPVMAAATRGVHVVTMMIAGTAVSAIAPFLLVPGPNLQALIAYQVVFSCGEALWSSRFLEYIADVAPPDKVGMYMGVAQVPWFLAKATTGLYSGVVLGALCPAQGEQRTGTLWLLYGAIAVTSPVGLWLARHWLRRGRLGRG